MSPSSVSALDGNYLLARSAELNRQPGSYSVPLHFAVHLRRPLPLRFSANATTYFQAPNKQALIITSVPRILRRFFGRNYVGLDTIPQTWPANYRVFSAKSAKHDGAAAYHLDAMPKTTGTISHVTFDLLVNGLSPVGVEWFYRDGSSIQITIENQRVERYSLPRSEQIRITMPRYALDAVCTTGPYVLDGPIASTIFESP
jgi:hypothetical protein